MSSVLRTWFAKSDVFSYNVVLRDHWIAQQASKLQAGTKLLDVGAGSCPYRTLFSHCEYRSQDLRPLQSEQLRFGGYGHIDYVSDLAAIPVPENSFDAVLCTEVLEHHPEPIKVVHELARIVRPGGTLILTAPLGSGIHQEPYHFYGGYTPWWYERFLTAAGFEEITIEPNQGSLRFFSQESLRFIRSTSPFGSAIPIWTRVWWLPIWIVLLPVLGVIIPVSCTWLDRFDRERRFTVGYHVTARRARST